MVRLRWTKVAIALLLASSALCQSTQASDDGQPARRPAAEDTAIEQLIDSARGLPPEYAADILLRLTKLNDVLISAKQKQSLLEEVFFLAPRVEHSWDRMYVGPSTGFRDATREASLQSAYGLDLDTLSLQSAVVRSMLAIDRVRARELFEMIRPPSARALRCENLFVEGVYPFYRCLELVTRQGFSPDEKRKGLHVELIASQLHRISSARELPSAARLLASPDLKDEDFVYLLALFCEVMRNAAYDVFSCSLSAGFPVGFQKSMRTLLKRARPLGTVADNLVMQYRDYLLRRFRADRCGDRMKDCRGFDVAYIPDVIKEFNEKFRVDSGVVVPAIHKEEMKKFSVLPAKAKLEEQDDVSEARRLRKDISRLIFGTGEALPPEQRKELAWEKEAERVLGKIEAWQATGVSAGLFHQKCNLYVSLLKACPAGRLRDLVLERYVSFLAGHWMENAHPIEWLSWVNRLLHSRSKSLKSIPKSQVLEMWSGSRDLVLGAYATLERLSGASVRGSSGEASREATQEGPTETPRQRSSRTRH
jgi:hypothetical protein